MLLFSRSVMSDFLYPRGLQHTRLPCPSLSCIVCSNWCPLSQWCHPTISSSVTTFSSCPQSFPAPGSFPVSRLRIRWPKYWSFSISPSNEYSRISFRMDWLDLLAVQGTLKSLLQNHSLKTSNLQYRAFFMVHLSHSYMKNTSLTIRTFVSQVMSLPFKTLPRFVIAFLSSRSVF